MWHRSLRTNCNAQTDKYCTPFAFLQLQQNATKLDRNFLTHIHNYFLNNYYLLLHYNCIDWVDSHETTWCNFLTRQIWRFSFAIALFFGILNPFHRTSLHTLARIGPLTDSIFFQLADGEEELLIKHSTGLEQSME